MTAKIERLLWENAFFMDILDRLPEACYIGDAEGNLIFINKAAEALDGYTLEEVRGRSTHEMYGLDETTSPLLMAKHRRTRIVDYTFQYYVNGREIVQVCNAGPIYFDDELIGSYTIQRDVTKWKEIIERNISFQKEIFNQKKKSGDKIHRNFQLIGDDPSFVACTEIAIRAAAGDSSVMIIGDTGSGKEMFARYIHENSARKDGPFLAINCAAIPESLLEGILFGTAKGVYTGAVEREGLLEQAAGGTLFLDEINSMPISSQSKLLRVLEERIIQRLGSSESIPIDVRIISSSNMSPAEAIKKGAIREDVFYRLAVVSITIPALSQRQGDVFLLAHHFIARYNEKFGKHIMNLDDEVLSFFLDFDWPGNVRQLKHCIESAMNFVGDDDYTIKKEHLPNYLFQEEEFPQSGYRQNKKQKPLEDGVFAEAKAQETEDKKSKGIFNSIQEKEKAEIVKALYETKGNVTKAAKLLKMSRQSLIYRLKKYGL